MYIYFLNLLIKKKNYFILLFIDSRGKSKGGYMLLIF